MGFNSGFKGLIVEEVRDRLHASSALSLRQESPVTIFVVVDCDKTVQVMYVKRNIGDRFCNHCCCGKATSVTQPECVYL